MLHTFAVYVDNKPGVLNRIDYDWALIDGLLPPPFTGVDSHA